LKDTSKDFSFNSQKHRQDIVTSCYQNDTTNVVFAYIKS